MKKELEVVAALIEKDGRILLCQRNEGDRYGLLWEFPGGSVESGEEFPQAIAREIEEELGLKVRAEGSGEEFFDEDAELKIRIFLFGCRILSGEPRAKDCRDFGFFTLKEMESFALAPADKKIYAWLKNKQHC